MTGAEATRAHVAALHRLLTDKLHVLPGARRRSPGELLSALVDFFDPLPTSLLRWWAEHPRGHVVVSDADPDGYVAGPQAEGSNALENVVWLSAETAGNRSLLLAETAYLLDHLLGCHGETGGLWLSDGGGLTDAWRQVGQRLHKNFTLGYAPDAAAVDPHAYFSWGLTAYLLDPRTLNVIDPLLERLLRTTILSDDFWRATPVPLPAAPMASAQ